MAGDAASLRRCWEDAGIQPAAWTVAISTGRTSLHDACCMGSVNGWIRWLSGLVAIGLQRLLLRTAASERQGVANPGAEMPSTSPRPGTAFAPSAAQGALSSLRVIRILRCFWFYQVRRGHAVRDRIACGGRQLMEWGQWLSWYKIQFSPVQLLSRSSTASDRESGLNLLTEIFIPGPSVVDR